MPLCRRAPHTLASYLDTLSTHAFGNYRDLLEAVSKHPAMGQYLTSLANRGDNGRVPDENFAREVMQLFSIGLVELNVDGTPKLVNGNPVDTYGMDDIRGLARVFTGWGWGNTGTPDPVNGRFAGNNPEDPMRRVIPMQFYAQYHSPLEKQFLGVTVPAGTAGPQALKAALDTLASHPNVGPFIATRLIQHMVTSNPSPAYVGRVAAVFNNNGSGVRGDLKATVRAVLFDRRGGHARQRAECRQAARADAAARGMDARFQCDLAERQLPHRRAGQPARRRHRCARRACSTSSGRATCRRIRASPRPTSLRRNSRSRTKSRWRRTPTSCRA